MFSKSAKKAVRTRPEIPSSAIEKDKLLPYLGLLLLVGAGYLVFIVFQNYAWPAFAALLLYVGFYGIHKQLLLYIARYLAKDKNTDAAAGWAAALSTLLACALIIGPGIFIVKQLIGEIYWLLEQIHNFLADEQALQKLESLPLLGDLVSRKAFFLGRYL